MYGSDVAQPQAQTESNLYGCARYVKCCALATNCSPLSDLSFLDKGRHSACTITDSRSWLTGRLCSAVSWYRTVHKPQSVRIDNYLIYALPLREGFYFDWKSRLAIVYVLGLRMLTPQQEYYESWWLLLPKSNTHWYSVEREFLLVISPVWAWAAWLCDNSSNVVGHPLGS
jgi:hypothetical protein